MHVTKLYTGNWFAIILLFTAPLFSQQFFFEREIRPFPIIDIQRNEIKDPFLGGLNAPIHQWVDIDGDDDLDLLISDNSMALTFFENIGTRESHDYIWRTDSFQNLHVGNWFKFLDIDNDLDFDLFAEKATGVTRLYMNVGSVSNPIFTIVIDSLRDSNGNYIRTEGFSIPDWTDIDCDGDLDFFLGKQNGTITFYENIGLWNGFPQFELITTSFEGLSIITGGVGGNPKTTHHGNNSITFTDINDDGDLDIFWGDLFASGIVYLENIGNCNIPRFTNSTIVEEYPLINPIKTDGYNFSRFGDIDNDGDLDMLFSSLIGSEFTSNLIFYENRGTNTAADFTLSTGQFINMLDIGGYSIPAFIDIDNDLDLDLFIANDIDIHSPLKANSRLYFFENQGNRENPYYLQITDNYLGFDKEFDVNYSPVFADLDNDGDYDLYLGGWNGKIIEYKNTGTAEIPNFTRGNEEYFNIDVGSNSTLAFADMDNDTDLDLFVGEFNGTLNYYRNDGNAITADYILQTNDYFSIRVAQYSFPQIKDLDQDGKLDLIMGSESDGVMYYRNTGTLEDAFFNQESGQRIIMHQRTTPVFEDIDNDFDFDLIAGVKGGGLIIYENKSVISNPDVNEKEIVNFPNPFGNQTQIRFTVCSNCPNPKSGTLKIFNILGQVIKSWIIPVHEKKTQINISWDGTNFDGQKVANGIYFSQLIEESTIKKSGKMLMLR